MQEPKIYSIKDLTRYIKQRLELDPELQNVWVRGEISNFKHHARGHMYFTLKDEECLLRAVMFAGYNRYLKFIPKNGMNVLVRGTVSVYERDGQYQFYAKEMQPDGIGSLHLAFEQLKERLQKEGLFSAERKRPLPVFPKVIGVVTSPTGAAVRDIVTTIRRRYPLADILIFPVQVQGEQAAPTISAAIQHMSERERIDVLIVGRGGGSIEELWAFNEEIVARSIFHSKVPVISAVGHETDFTIADFVADVRAATPTAAAELAVPHVQELKQQHSYLQARLYNNLKRQIQAKKETLKKLQKSYAFRHPHNRLQQAEQQLDRAHDRLMRRGVRITDRKREQWQQWNQRLRLYNPQQRLTRVRTKLNDTRQRLIKEALQQQRERRTSLSHLVGKLDALSPLKVMQRGYSLVYNEDKSLVKSVRMLNPGDSVSIVMNDGELDCQVWGIREGSRYEQGKK